MKKEKKKTVKILCVIFYGIILLLISAFTTPLILKFTPNIALTEKHYLDTFIFILTLIVAVIAVLFAVIGLYEFSKIEKIKENLSSFNNRMDEMRQVMIIHNQTMLQLNEILYKETRMIAENTNSKELLEEVTLNYQIALLYSTNFGLDDSDSYEKKEDAFNYIQTKGTTNVIKYLEFIANNDTDKRNRLRAREVIGSIKERERNKA